MTINCDTQPIPSCTILNAKFLLSHLTKHFSITTELKDDHQHESENNSIFLSLQIYLHPHITCSTLCFSIIIRPFNIVSACGKDNGVPIPGRSMHISSPPLGPKHPLLKWLPTVISLGIKVAEAC